MKKTLLFILTTFALNAHSQLTYVDVDWVIDQTQVMPDGQTDVQEFDIDIDGTNDMRITSWSNHQAGIETVIELIMPDAVGFGGVEVSGSSGYISDCPSSGFTYQSIGGYIYTSDETNPYNNQYVKMPFRFQGSAGVHCGFLYVRYVGTTITIEGYAWNPTPSGICSCTSSGWLSLKEIELDGDEYKLYDLMGNRVDTPEGLTLKVYESGHIEKVFVMN